jgi:hypothetical protein
VLDADGCGVLTADEPYKGSNCVHVWIEINVRVLLRRDDAENRSHEEIVLLCIPPWGRR